jgi:phosphodiesterase/alkaline phosphatase D-like protein
VSHRPTRRAVLKGAAVLAVLPVAGFTGERRLSPAPKDPFTLGVASGDPAPDGAVIWTRLAPEPLADDGLGGMPARADDVEWEVATDEAFARVERRGLTTAVPESAHSVHVELAGLRRGDGSDSRDDIDAVRPENPDIRYFSNRRGYVRTRITPDEVRANFRVLPFVSSPGAPALTGASFVVADREPTLHPV